MRNVLGGIVHANGQVEVVDGARDEAVHLRVHGGDAGCGMGACAFGEFALNNGADEVEGLAEFLYVSVMLGIMEAWRDL